MRDMQRYVRFVKEQQAKERASGDDGKLKKWPAWKFKDGTLLGTPSVTVLNTVFRAAYQQVRKWCYTARCFPSFGVRGKLSLQQG